MLCHVTNSLYAASPTAVDLLVMHVPVMGKRKSSEGVSVMHVLHESLLENS